MGVAVGITNLSRTAIARFELLTHRDADTPLIRELMAGYR